MHPYISGLKLDLNNRENWLGIIGSRNASKNELKRTRHIAKHYASKGFIIVSGLASGVDTAAHLGALDTGGITIAIVSTPIDSPIYPRENRTLAERIKQSGCIIHPFMSSCREDRSEKPTHFTKRLLERDRLLGYACPKIIATSDKEIISGGTRYAVKYGMEYDNKVYKVYRMDSGGKFYESPNHDWCNIGWGMELDIESFFDAISAN